MAQKEDESASKKLDFPHQPRIRATMPLSINMAIDPFINLVTPSILSFFGLLTSTCFSQPHKNSFFFAAFKGNLPFCLTFYLRRCFISGGKYIYFLGASSALYSIFNKQNITFSSLSEKKKYLARAVNLPKKRKRN
jgi:hypothetical protein